MYYFENFLIFTIEIKFNWKIRVDICKIGGVMYISKEIKTDSLPFLVLSVR